MDDKPFNPPPQVQIIFPPDENTYMTDPSSFNVTVTILDESGRPESTSNRDSETISHISRQNNILVATFKSIRITQTSIRRGGCYYLLFCLTRAARANRRSAMSSDSELFKVISDPIWILNR